jgi:Flp pilus assembly protein TadG
MRNLNKPNNFDLRDNSGSMTIAFAFFMPLMLMGLAISVDYGRALAISQRVTIALDAAALAGAKMLDTDTATDADIIARTQNYFQAEMARIGATNVSFNTMVPTIDRSASKVTTSITGVVNSYFGKTVGISNIPVHKTATVVYKMRKVELSMALDITGSMNQVPAGDTRTKIDSLRISATNLVDTLFSRSLNDSGIRIALAPYSSSVNVDWRTFQVTDGAANSGCVVERGGANTTTDAPAFGVDAVLPAPSGATCPNDPIIPLLGRSGVSTLKTAISGFNANGSTAGHIGTAWAWYMISPTWSSLFSGPSAPEPYSADVVKNVVIMTDGLFNTSYLSGYPRNSQQAIDESYAEFLGICTNMKARNINVYTVLFGLADPVAEAKMQACASSPSNYFTAVNGAQLEASFTTITDRLNNLRVSQ